jgi:hypothetical protein
VNNKINLIFMNKPDCTELKMQEFYDSGGLSNLSLMLDLSCAPPATSTPGGPPPTPTWTSNGSTPTVTATPPRVRVVIYQTGDDEVTVQEIDSVDEDLENLSNSSQTAVADVVQLFINVFAALPSLLDIDPPILTVSGDQTIEATGPAGARAFFTARSRDAIDMATGEPRDPAPLVECRDQANHRRLSGNTFGIGQWTVRCVSWDHRIDPIDLDLSPGNISPEQSFIVNVVDTTPPELSGSPNRTVLGAGPGGAIVNLDVTATDRVSGPAPVTCVPPSGTQFPVGMTSVSCTAPDFFGNTSAPFLVSVNVVESTRTFTATATATATSTATHTHTATATATDTATATATATATVTATPTNTPLPLGADCAAPGTCGSGFCEDGVCCDRACSAPDEICDRPGNDRGTCGQPTPAPAPTLSLAGLAVALAAMALLARGALRKRSS